jgi:hypothetical protein
MTTQQTSTAATHTMTSTTDSSTSTSSPSRPQRTRRLPEYLEDYELEVDFRRNYDDDLKEEARISPKKKKAKKVAKKVKETKQKRKQTTAKARTTSPAIAKQPKKASRTSVTVPTYTNPLNRFATTNTAADAHNRFRQYQSAGIDEDEVLRILLNQSSFDNTFQNEIQLGTNCKAKWSLSNVTNTGAQYTNTLGVDKMVTVDEILNSCHYHPGKIHNEFKKPTVEIVFSFDATGSMYQAVDELKQKLSSLLHQLLTDLPDIRIAVIAHGDYCDAGVYYTLRKLDFTNDIDTLVQFVQSITMCGGGDPEECYELALLECSRLNWYKPSLQSDAYPEDITRVLVVIGDDVPHAPNEYFKIDWRQELKSLYDSLGLKVYGVQCLGRDYADSFYQELADTTYGTRLELSSFSRIQDLVSGLCYKESAEQASIHFANRSPPSTSTSSSTTSSTTTEATDTINLSNENLLKIHHAMHDSTQNTVNVNGEDIDITTSTDSCRHVNVEGIALVTQDPTKNTRFGKMAREGHKVTWIVKKGLWSYICDETIVRR